MRPTLICLIAILAITTRPAAADCQMEPAASVPLLPGERPLIQTSINGKAVQMVVDTGATASAITPEAAAILGLRRDPNRQTSSVTVGGHDISRNAIVETLSIASLNFTNLSVAVMPLVDKATGLNPGGLVGVDLLIDHDIELDFPRRTLTFYRTGDCHRPPWHGEYATITGGGVGQHKFLFPIELNNHSVTALFDTGSLGETVARSLVERIGISDAQLANDTADTGTSAGQHQYTIRRHKFDMFRIGSETFHDVPLDVVDLHQPGVEMLIGADYMHARRFLLSWSTATLFVQRQPAAIGSPSGATPDQCRPPADISSTLAHASPVAVNRPRLNVPEKAVSDRVDGCAGVMFHVAADGTPTDIRLVVENPPGYGLGDFVVHEISASKYSPNADVANWYDEAHRIHPKQTQ